MSNSFYTHGAFPSTGSAATSASMRAELDLISAGFDKMPTLSGNANLFVVINSTGTGLTQTSTLPSATFTDTLFTIQDDGDNTRKFQFNASTVTPGATRIYSVPDANTTLVGTGTTQTLTNKTLTAPVISSIVNTGTLTLPTSTDTLVGRATTDTLTNKTLTSPAIATIVNTGTLTLPTSTDTLVGRATTDTLTNKTLTSPVIATIVNTGTLTLPTSTDTLVGRATTDTLTNKTLTSPVIATIVNTGTLTLPTSTDTLVGRATTDTLTNKTLGAFTISGAVSGGGNQINNVIIGASTPLAGSFTTLSTTGLASLPSTGRSAAAALTVTNPAFLYGVASTYTDTASSGTIAAMAPFYSISGPTLSTSNVTTYTNSATLYIANAPTAGGSATITNPYSIYVAAGAAYFGGAVTATGAITLNTTTNNQSYTTTGAGTITISSGTAGSINNINIGATTAGTGKFTAITNSALTSGRVVYSTTGGLETDSAGLTFDGTNLSVGGSISSTIASKTAQFNAAGGSIYASFADGTKTWRFGAGIQSAGTVSLYNATDAVTAYTVDATGNVGIGTSSPTGISSYPTVDIKGTSGGAIRVGSATYQSYIYTDAAGMTIGTATGQGVNFFTNGTQKAVIDSSGNVGIGTSSPSYKLDVVGTGDLANRVSTTGTSNAASIILQSGSGTTSGLFAYARFLNNDTNAQDWRIGTYGTNNLSIVNAKAGTVPVTVDTSGNVLVTNPAGLGYGTGSGGTVTQATSKSTAVTLNKPTGKITTTADALASNTTVAFTFNNSLIAATDNVVFTFADGNGYQYLVWAYNMLAGSCTVALRNITAGSLSQALPINFAIIKGATA